MNKERFCLITVTLRKDKQNNLTNLREICSRVHSHHGARISWALDIGALKERDELLQELVSYRKQYDDDVTLDLGASTIQDDRQRIRNTIDEGMAKLQYSLGNYPKSIASGHLNAKTLDYIHQKYGVEIAEAFLWEQMGVDGYSTDGGIHDPYYPSRHNTLVPAQSENERLDLIVLDGWTRELCEQKYPLTSCMALHPWDADRVAGDGLTFMKYISDVFLKHNLAHNAFGLLCMRVEVDWINQTFWVNNKNQQIKRRFFDWLDYMFTVYPEIRYTTLTQFNGYFRSRYPDNTELTNKYFERSKYEPNQKVYWYFCKDYRAAVEWYSQDKGRPQTLILTTSDFRRNAVRQGPYGWFDGYDGADFPNMMYPTFPSNSVRSCAHDGCKDSAEFQVKGGHYDIWILSDGTKASDIEILIDGKLIEIADGTRGEDDWSHIGKVNIPAGKHLIELCCRANPEGEGWAIYSQLILTQEVNYKPPRKRLLKSSDYLATVSYTLYHKVPEEPTPPANDWGLKDSGTLLKRHAPLKEVLFKGNKILDLTSQAYLQDIEFYEFRLGNEAEKEEKPQQVPFNIHWDGIEETENMSIVKFSLFDDDGLFLRKRIIFQRKSVSYEYEYHKPFDKLLLTDAFGQEKILEPVPDKLVFQKGKIVEVLKRKDR